MRLTSFLLKKGMWEWIQTRKSGNTFTLMSTMTTTSEAKAFSRFFSITLSGEGIVSPKGREFLDIDPAQAEYRP
jgi:hypothetical protein